MHLTTTARAILLCLPVLCARPTLFAWAQESAPPSAPLPTIVVGDLSQALSGRDIPLSLRLLDLDTSWRVFNASGATSITSYAPFSSVVGSGPAGAFYTRGQAVSVGGTTLLIAYRLSLSPAQLREQGNVSARFRIDDEAEAPPRLPGRTPLGLTLLNLSQLSALNDIRPFDPSTIDPSASAEDAQLDRASASNLKQVGLALLQYTQDYDERLPPMRSATSMSQIRGRASGRPSTVQEVLLPYARSASIFAHPRTHEIYRPNPALSGQPLSRIANPSKAVTFYEASPNGDKKRAVLFLDGHVERIPESAWPRLKQASRTLGAIRPPTQLYAEDD